MAGAVAVVVFDNVDGPLIPMAKKVEDDDVNVPAVFVSKESGEALETLLNDPKHGKTVVVTLESPDSPFDDWPNVATSACVTFGALCVLLSVVVALKRREEAHLAATAAARPPETRLLSAEEVAAVAKTAVFSSRERVLSFLRGDSCGGAATAGEDGEDDTLVVDNGTGDTCAVCIEDYESGDELRALDCGHAFHKDCIDPWLITKRACCPVCKHVIAPPPPPPEDVPRQRRRSRWSVLSNASATRGGAESADESDLEAPLLPASSPAGRTSRRGVIGRWLTRRTAPGGHPDASSPAVSPVDADDVDADNSDPGGVDDADESTAGGGEEEVRGGDLEAGEARGVGEDGTDGEE